MFPSRLSLSKAWPTISPHFAPTSTLHDIEIPTTTYRLNLVLPLSGHVVGRLQDVWFMSMIGVGLMPCIILPSPSFGAWRVHLMGILGIMLDQTSTAQRKSVTLTYGCLTTRDPTFMRIEHVGVTLLYLSVYVRWPAFILGYGRLLL